MSWALEFDPDARGELYAGSDHYEAKAVGLGVEFFEEAAAVVHGVCENPGQWAVIHKVGAVEVRRAMLRRFPFNIVFIVLKDRVRVVAVAHQRRQPGYWMERIAGG